MYCTTNSKIALRKVLIFQLKACCFFFEMEFWALLQCCIFLLVYHSSPVGAQNKSSSYCERPWPSLELFLPIHIAVDSSRNKEFVNFFLRTFLLFWPHRISRTSLRVIIDEEWKTHPLGLEAKKTVDNAKAIVYNASVTYMEQSPWYNNLGYDRQQFAMYWADNYTNAEYVGFVDADTIFVTYVDREDLFEDGKPVVNARIGLNTRKPWSLVPGVTWGITGMEEPMRCMSYFPVIVKVEHLRGIREMIEKHNKKPFNLAFQEFTKRGFSCQFNIMCTYLFNYHRDDYVWYTHDTTPEWDGFHPRPVWGQWGDKSIYDKSFFLPKPRVSTHARYHKLEKSNIFTSPALLREVIQRGICDSPPFPKVQKYCEQWPRDSTSYNKEMHTFDYVDYWELANMTELLEQHRHRYDRIKDCNHTWLEQDEAVTHGA